MWTTRFLLRPIRRSLDDSLSRKMLRRFATFSRRVAVTKIWLHNYRRSGQVNSKWLLPMLTQHPFQSNVVGCTPITGLRSMKIKLRTSFLLRYGLGQSRVQLDEKAEEREQHMQPVEGQTGRMGATRMTLNQLLKPLEFRPLGG